MISSRRQFCAAGAALFPLALRAAPRPKLLVWLIAEQFRPDYLDELWPFPGPGGFRRLVEGGTYFPNCQFDSASFTSSGLATLLTGAWPANHGIVADRWFDPSAAVPVEADAASIKAGTFFDAVLAIERNRVFTISSGSAAAFLSGCKSTRAYASAAGAWKATIGENPDWLRSFNESNDAAKWNGARWFADNGPATGAKPLRVVDPLSYDGSPFALANQFALARETILHERTGMGDGFDVLTLLIGSPGVLGIETGANSPLMRDLILRLDNQVSLLIDLLDDRVGKGNYAVAFTAAHGLDSRTPARAGVDSRVIAGAVPHARAYLYPFVYLGTDAHDERQAAAEAAMHTGKIAGYYTGDGECSHKGAWRDRFVNSFFPGRSGDLMLSYPAHCGEAADAIAAGSLYNYDTRVPLLFYGTMFPAETIEDTVSAIDVAPTLSRLSGLELPAASTGRVLGAR